MASMSRDEWRRAYAELVAGRNRNRDWSTAILIGGAGLVIVTLLAPLHLGFWSRLLVMVAALVLPAYVIERTVPKDGFSRRQWIAVIVLFVVLLFAVAALRVAFDLAG